MNIRYYIAFAFCSWMVCIACEKESDQYTYDFEIDPRMEINADGFYELELSESWQTLHRIGASVPSVVNDYDLIVVRWRSSHSWLIGDTLGYVVHQYWTLNDTTFYAVNDTSYVDWFDGFEVPTINSVSYSTLDGEVNTMFAPVRSMAGDTVRITGTAQWPDGVELSDTFSVILQ